MKKKTKTISILSDKPKKRISIIDCLIIAFFAFVLIVLFASLPKAAQIESESYNKRMLMHKMQVKGYPDG